MSSQELEKQLEDAKTVARLLVERIKERDTGGYWLPSLQVHLSLVGEEIQALTEAIAASRHRCR